METTQAAVVESPYTTEPKKRGGRPKGSKNKKDVLNEKTVTSGFKDQFDRKLDHFQYTTDPGASQDWEEENPLNSTQVRNIKKKYPGMRCRFVSQYSLDKRGKGYRGWQIFSDGEHPNGIKVGNDLFLAMMPEDRAKKFNDEMAYRSTRELVKLQEDMTEMQLGSGLTDKELKDMGAPDGSTMGMTIGAKPKTKAQFGGKVIRGGGFTRGRVVSRAEAREQFVKRIEKERIASTRVYSFGKRGT